MLKASLSIVAIGIMFSVKTIVTLISEYVFNTHKKIAI